MKSSLIVVITLSWLAVAPVSPAESTNHAVALSTKAPSTGTTTNSTPQQISEANKKARAKFATLTRKLNELKAKAQKETGDARADLERTIAALQKELDSLKPTLDNLQTATTNTWSDIKSAFDQGVKDVEKDLKDLP